MKGSWTRNRTYGKDKYLVDCDSPVSAMYLLASQYNAHIRPHVAINVSHMWGSGQVKVSTCLQGTQHLWGPVNITLVSGDFPHTLIDVKH